MIHTIVQNKHLLTHPFYQLWLDGKLPKQALQKYSEQYFQLVEHLPRFISTLHTNCDDVVIRQQLIQNLMEEELGHGNGNVAHTELWLDFAEELGVERNKVPTTKLLEATKNAVQTIKQACESSIEEGAAALYAYESQVPEISEYKIKGLQEFYNINSEKALRFFEVHKISDKKHRAVWQAMVNRFSNSATQLAKAEQAAIDTTDALWKMFDEMHATFVPEMVC